MDSFKKFYAPGDFLFFRRNKVKDGGRRRLKGEEEEEEVTIENLPCGVYAPGEM